MMNAARLNVGAEGVGVAERAFQQALAYAQDRRQGRSPWSADPTAALIDHPDVRRTLSLMKAKIEAARGLCFSTAVASDLARWSPDPVVRASASLREELFTPIAKAWSTEIGVEAASAGVQVHGGMGFIEETGAAQHYRDARIAPIYEGANGIQAIDLAGRKLGLDGGAAVTALFADIRVSMAAMTAPPLLGLASRLAAGVAAAERASAYLLARRGTSDNLAGATPYLMLMGELIGGWMLAKSALAALEHHGSADPFYGARIRLARLYGEQVLTGAEARADAACAGSEDLSALTAEALSA
jgi:hypothetical protein